MAKTFKFSVNARDLYDAARIGTPFSTWIGARLRSHGYEPRQDYLVVEGGRYTRAEVLITLEAAYCIAGNMRGTARQNRAHAYLSDLTRKPGQGKVSLSAAKSFEMFAV
ncbi:MAG: hypothetical protein VR64_07215 [Desulfatitalea sp. BRH_c12]|nr:MAG: hypothetical protein VR64_07215 [Desulfatitalea sp. BRH_c12]